MLSQRKIAYLKKLASFYGRHGASHLVRADPTIAAPEKAVAVRFIVEWTESLDAYPCTHS